MELKQRFYIALPNVGWAKGTSCWFQNIKMPQESLVCFSQFKKFKKPEGTDYSERPGQQLIVLVAVVTQINWVKY